MPSWYSGPEWLVPDAAQQARLERYLGGTAGARSRFATGFVESGDLHFRQFPVERRFFTAEAAMPRCSHVQQIPRADASCADGAEAKFFCGSVATLAGPRCEMWSIGSNGQSCFEEEWHALVPTCRVRVYDPTLRPAARAHMEQLQRKGVLEFHPIGRHEARPKPRTCSSARAPCALLAERGSGD